MEVDGFQPDRCCKRKLQTGSQERPSKHSRPAFTDSHPQYADDICKPSRFLYLNNGKWKPYCDEVSATIWISFSSNKKSARFWVSEQAYSVDFPHMMQLNLRTGHVCSIAWIDSLGKFVRPVRCVEGRSELWLSLVRKKSQKISSDSQNYNCAQSQQQVPDLSRSDRSYRSGLEERDSGLAESGCFHKSPGPVNCVCDVGNDYQED
ncbi:hypothetical protein KP509_17G046400 [Ceratopteris richardii]|uniref:WWE domain-containing protein n=1 Tax=Ceratopteris richardii TaxID=49495 RepID=A0A8T2STZ9_CERRI|nr:hypothetical protein KP509_17G046400 [Ceratopteris richardii]